MSNATKAKVKQKFQQQLYKNYARHIQAKIRDARSSPEDAGNRWPFELLQNAHDAGLRPGKNCIEVSIGWTPDGNSHRLFFEHDGAPFSVDDITALQSGGSNKDFESEITTGRFGTGFLVTHVLSPRTRVMGLLAVDEGLERFDLLLDRSGSEEAIIQNIMDCEESIGRAELLQDSEGCASARFEYLVEEGSSLTLGIEALRGTLPYLFSTCPLLRKVTLRRLDGVTDIWVGDEVFGHLLSKGYLHERPVQVMTIETGEVRELRSLRFSLTEHEKSSALVVLDQDGDSWAARIPDAAAARLYVRFPIRGTNELPFAFVLNGLFDVEQERRHVHLNDDSKGLLQRALEVAPLALQYLTNRGVREAHRLATVCPPPSRVGDVTTGWWTEQLKNLAHRFSCLPIIETTSGLRPAVESDDDDRFTDFVYPQIKADSLREEVDIEMVWPLLAEMTDYAPPQKYLARSWTDISKGWKVLGVNVETVSLERLADYIRAKAKRIEELPLGSGVSRLEWLMMFLDVLGRCATNRREFDAAILAGLLPNQKGDLCAPADLRKDAGIPEALKDIARVLGDDVRTRLLHQDLLLRASSPEGSNIQHVLDGAVQESMCESLLIEALIRQLEKGLQAGRKAAEADKALLDGSQRLLLYLWETQGAAAADVARRIPLLTLDNTLVRWDKEKMLMAPVPVWHVAAQACEFAYPRNRVLDACYHQPGNKSEDAPLVDALVSWGIAYRDPLIRVTPTELKDRRLAALVEQGTNTLGITLSGHEFSQIALLDNELINRCTNREEGIEVARALLGLVLNYAAVYDPLWREFREVSGRQNRADIPLRVRQALWVAELKTRKWVPVLESDDQEVARANLTNLKTLLDPRWLSGNEDAIRLLSECFAFDSLEVRLLSFTQGEDRQREVRQSLASLLEKTAGSTASLQQLVRIATADIIDVVAQLVDAASEDSTVLSELTVQLQERKRRAQQVQRQREFGLAVQAAIKAALEARSLYVKVIDRGFDFAVSIRDSDDPAEVSAAEFMIGDRYLVEVKATTTDEVRMTAEQAKTAAAAGEDRYVLCVVALPETLPSGLPEEQVRKIVEDQARLLPDISCRIRTTWELVEQAKYGEVGIRNEKMLRYGVPRSAWTAGLTIEQWVSQIAVVLGSQVQELEASRTVNTDLSV